MVNVHWTVDLAVESVPFVCARPKLLVVDIEIAKSTLLS